MKTLLVSIVAILVSCADIRSQVICKEGFGGLPIDAIGLQGSGTDALGWTSSTWQAGNDAHCTVVSPIPELSQQVSGGGFINGSDRALLLSTSPEPVPSGLAAYREFPTQNTTVYFSFLVRPQSVGTGSDSIRIRIGNGSANLISIAFSPDQAQRWLNIDIQKEGGSGFSGTGSGRTLLTEQTYLVVLRVTRPSSTSIQMEYWLDPTGTYAQGPVYSGTVNGLTSSLFSRIGFPIISSDTGGPSTSLIIDEFKMGYTWNDVIAQRSPPMSVPNVTISPAIGIQWQTENGKYYQVQYSYDLNNWLNLNTEISGNGQVKKVLDSTEDSAKKFYRVQIR